MTESGDLATNELWGPDGLGRVRRHSDVQVRCHDDLIAAGWRPERGGVAMMLAFLLAVAAAALGIVGLLHLARGRDPAAYPKQPTRPPRDPAQLRRAGLAAALALGVLVVTRWPAAALAAGGLALLWPRVFGGAAAGRRELRKIEAIAVWTESLRDTSAAASGLEQAIPATVSSAPELLQRPLRDLSARLAGTGAAARGSGAVRRRP